MKRSGLLHHAALLCIASVVLTGCSKGGVVDGIASVVGWILAWFLAFIVLFFAVWMLFLATGGAVVFVGAGLATYTHFRPTTGTRLCSGLLAMGFALSSVGTLSIAIMTYFQDQPVDEHPVLLVYISGVCLCLALVNGLAATQLSRLLLPDPASLDSTGPTDGGQPTATTLPAPSNQPDST